MRGYPQFSFWISITLVKIYFSCIIEKRGKDTFELVGTVLNVINFILDRLHNIIIIIIIHGKIFYNMILYLLYKILILLLSKNFSAQLNNY